MAVGAGQRACKNQYFRPKTRSANSIAVLRLAFQNCLQNRHKMQLSRSRFFYRKTTLSCPKARFNTENCRNENISLKNRNQVQRKLKTTAIRGKWCTKPSTQKKPFFTAKLPEVRRQTSSLAVSLSPSFFGVQSSPPVKEHYSSFHFAGTLSGSNTSRGSLNLALLQWVLLCYCLSEH